MTVVRSAGVSGNKVAGQSGALWGWWRVHVFSHSLIPRMSVFLQKWLVGEWQRSPRASCRRRVCPQMLWGFLALVSEVKPPALPRV